MDKSNAAASIKFQCSDRTAYYTDCVWRATKGLSSASGCTRSYKDAGMTQIYNQRTCNVGSQGVGEHCADCSTGFTYCSHCDRGDGAGGHNRKGCGCDSWGYSKSGTLWVRGKIGGSGANLVSSVGESAPAFTFDKSKTGDTKTRGCV